ncbi:type II secretion system protein [Salmonella enterica subsp. enterica serovar Infantis]|nr:type II secretion system protein [Salmonella enterica subsp. enterica serovar Infantis]
MNHLSKKKQSQRAFTLIEVAFVIILFVLGVLGGVYYLHQEREFTTANLIAKQLSYIAGSVAQFSWPVTEESKKIQTYDITALEKMGVISSDIKYMLHYQSDYSGRINIPTPNWFL